MPLSYYFLFFVLADSDPIKSRSFANDSGLGMVGNDSVVGNNVFESEESGTFVRFVS